MKDDNNQIIVGLIVVVAVILITGAIGFDFKSYEMMGGYSMMRQYGYGGVIEWVISIFIVLLIIAIIYWLIKNTKRIKISNKDLFLI
jgi:uncharacterized membrane protein